MRLVLIRHNSTPPQETSFAALRRRLPVEATSGCSHPKSAPTITCWSGVTVVLSYGGGANLGAKGSPELPLLTDQPCGTPSCMYILALFSPSSQLKRPGSSFFQRAINTKVLTGLIFSIYELCIDNIIFWGWRKTASHILDDINYRIKVSNLSQQMQGTEYAGHVLDKSKSSFCGKEKESAVILNYQKVLRSFRAFANCFRERERLHSKSFDYHVRAARHAHEL